MVGSSAPPALCRKASSPLQRGRLGAPPLDDRAGPSPLQTEPPPWWVRRLHYARMKISHRAWVALPALWLAVACEETKAPAGPEGAPAGDSRAAESQAADSPAEGQAPLAVGDPAPDVTMTLHDGKKLTLKSLQGKHVLVYFYPKDDTPGCRIEAQGIRDSWEDFEKAGVQVLGVSLQDAASHQAFIDKESLPFPLVVDEGGEVAKAFRVPVKGEYASRQSFLVDPRGKLKSVWLDVDPKSHAAEVLAAVDAK
jgi:thioredoxin-dependent peroxiredoxin